MSDTKQGDPAHVMTSAIYDAMMWNLRAYGKLACEEDAEFFAACALKELGDAGFEVRRSVHSMPLPLASSGNAESSDLQGDSAEDSR